jgi:formate--tetrahydrofolate ligase
MSSNLEMAREVRLAPISTVAADFGLDEADYEPLGLRKAKLTWEGVLRLKARERGRLVLVTAITPTPAGEGKTTVSVGLAQGLQKIGRRAMPALREPALGPLFGVKGGATGGGRSQVLPSEDINLFFTGDFPAIAAAHNLLSAMIDAHIANGNDLDLDVRRIRWPRTVDMNDRALRQVNVALGGRANGFPREDSFVITPASEVMAILCLAESLSDLQERLGRIEVGETRRGRTVTASELKAPGAMAVLLHSALRPNLVQTSENGAALIHGGPFANIAHGCSSMIATQCALGMAEYTVTEGGFGADLGGRKFLTIKAPLLGKLPDVIVVVATVRALKSLGGGSLGPGLANLRQHLGHMAGFGRPVVAAVNRFANDAEADLARVVEFAKECGAAGAVVVDPWASGGEGCRALAEDVHRAAEAATSPGVPGPQPAGVLAKLNLAVEEGCGGQGVSLSAGAQADLARIEKAGHGELPVCLAKTPASLTDDPSVALPSGPFQVHVQRLRVSAGAGFVVAEAGDIMLMPGLGKDPRAAHIFVDEDGQIQGLN